jgi:hypothetical protein
MSRTRKDSNRGGGRVRHISVRAVRRNPPDLKKLSRALIQLAMAQAEAEAKAQQEGKSIEDGDQEKWRATETAE